MEETKYPVFYKNAAPLTEINKSEEPIILTAKMAREITNATIISNIHNNVLPKVKEEAKKGLTTYKFKTNMEVDYRVGVEYLKSLGYCVTVKQLYSNCMEVKLNW